MSLRFLNDSILTTVQDLGRNGFRSLGINPNGVMDRKAARLINVLLGNTETEAVLEIHFPAPKILFERDIVIALGGADFAAQTDNRKVQNWRPVFIKKDEVLSFPYKVFGNRIYLAVRGGFEINEWLESRSTNLKARIGGYKGRKIVKDDAISFALKSNFKNVEFDYFISADVIPKYSGSPILRFIKGIEWEKLDKKSQNKFLSQEFSLSSNSDRMGFYLKGNALHLAKKVELVSSAVNFGTIQLLPSGQMILLMADHQTTGGYPRIAHICADDLPIAAQLGANDSLSFEMITVEEAENLSLSFEKNLNLLKTAVKFR